MFIQRLYFAVLSVKILTNLRLILEREQAKNKLFIFERFVDVSET